MKKLIACVLAVSLLLSVSALAATSDPYSIDEDVTLISFLAADQSAATMALEDPDSGGISLYGSSGYSTELDALNNISSEVEAIYSVTDWISSHFVDYNSNGLYTSDSLMGYVDSIESLLSDLKLWVVDYNSSGSFSDDSIMGQLSLISDGISVLANSSSVDYSDILDDIYSSLVNSRDVAYLSQINANLVDLFYFFDPDDTGHSLTDVLAPLNTSIQAVTSKIETQTKVNKGVPILGSDGEPTTTASATTITYLLRLGLLGLDESVDTVNTSVGTMQQVLDSDLKSVDLSVDEFNTSLTELLTLREGNSYLGKDGIVYELGTGNAGSSLSIDRVVGAGLSGLAQMMQLGEGQKYLMSNGATAVVSAGNSVFLDRLVGEGFSGMAEMMQLSSGQSYLSGNAKITTVADGATLYLDRVVGEGFSGLGNMLQLSEGNIYLGADGKEYQLASGNVVGLDRVTARGFAGIRSLLAGSEEDNVYQGTVTSNENAESSFSATGLGPMLNTWLDAIQLDTGRLSYIFASPSDLQAKKDSESVTEAAADSFLDPDSDASVKLSDVGVLKDTSSKVKQLGDTGVSVSQAFDQLGNADLFAFFTDEAASDLDSRVSTYSRDPSDRIVTNYYEQSRTEFFELIGKEE